MADRLNKLTLTRLLCLHFLDDGLHSLVHELIRIVLQVDVERLGGGQLSTGMRIIERRHDEGGRGRLALPRRRGRTHGGRREERLQRLQRRRQRRLSLRQRRWGSGIGRRRCGVGMVASSSCSSAAAPFAITGPSAVAAVVRAHFMSSFDGELMVKAAPPLC